MLLLWAIEDVFDSNGGVVFTEQLLSELKLADKMWASLTPITLALLLSDYGVRPKSQRIGQKVAKGYRKEYFDTAWVSYPRPQDEVDTFPDPVTPVTPVTMEES